MSEKLVLHIISNSNEYSERKRKMESSDMTKVILNGGDYRFKLAESRKSES
jgi:hypothetical protein